MPNVHHINESRDDTIKYQGLEIHITHRKETNDFEYQFVMTQSYPFNGHASTYSNCVRDAKSCADRILGGKK